MLQLLLERKLHKHITEEHISNVRYTVNPDTECWEVSDRAKNKDGYPVARIGGKVDTLYRHFYAVFNGKLKSGMVIRHKCDNRLCCNPTHLIIGSQKQNVADMLIRGRFPMGEKNGRAKLDVDKAARIREAFGSGAKITDLAKEYGVDRKAIYKIVNGETWRISQPD